MTTIRVPSKSSVGFWLGAIVGLVGVFGIGQLYLGRRLRGITFLAMTAVLYILVLIGLYAPQLWQTPANPAAVLGVLWLVQTYDLYTLTKRSAASNA